MEVMSDYGKVLKGPVIGLLVVLVTALGVSLVGAMPDRPAVTLAPFLMGFGAWLGYRYGTRHGANYTGLLVAGFLLGLVGAVLHVLLFGGARGLGTPILTDGVTSFALVFWGAIVGGGFALSK
jgi:hypothetical protein